MRAVACADTPRLGRNPPTDAAEDLRKVSIHDPRKLFAQWLLVDQQMNPRVVMAVGGWNSFAAIEPYLNSPTEDVVDEAFADISL